MIKNIYKKIFYSLMVALPIVSIGATSMVSCSSNNNNGENNLPNEDVLPTTKTNLNLSTSSSSYIVDNILTIPSNFITLSGSLNNKNVTKIIIQGKISNLPDDCFSNCTSLNYVEFIYPDSLTTIGASTFENCQNLSFKIPMNVTTIGPLSFSGVDEVTFSEQCKLSTIGDYAFMNANFSAINLPHSVTNLGNGVFYNCEKLESFVFPKNIKSVSNNLFNNCRLLSNVTFTNSIVSIGQWAFNNCINLTNLSNLSEKLFLINQYAFAYCTSLTTIVIPNSLKEIGGQIFMGCSNLTNITMPKGFDLIELSPNGPIFQKQLGLTEEQWNNINWNEI